MNNYLTEHFKISDKLINLAETAESELAEVFSDIKDIASYNQLKVLKAMQESGLSSSHFGHATGYGYSDSGRDIVEDIYANVMGTESALVRIQLISGTHAISTALSACLNHGDELLSLTGTPYDTLHKVIGITPAEGSLISQGIIYKEAALGPDGLPDKEKIRGLITDKTKVAAIQRSKGYSLRRSFTVGEINELVQFVKSINSGIICFVDNCYGEFTELNEPTADLLAGSLIKNPGGGLAPSGGYIAGKEELVLKAASRLNFPGAGKDMGASLGISATFAQGLFHAPQVVKGAIMGATFGAKMFELLNIPHTPAASEKRTDIVQTATFGTPDAILAFCLGIQKASPVDSFVTPIASAMPGYDSGVVMAQGGFIQGASIELSADGPIRPPYTVFFQGGLSYDHSRLGILMGLNEVLKKL